MAGPASQPAAAEPPRRTSEARPPRLLRRLDQLDPRRRPPRPRRHRTPPRHQRARNSTITLETINDVTRRSRLPGRDAHQQRRLRGALSRRAACCTGRTAAHTARCSPSWRDRGSSSILTGGATATRPSRWATGASAAPTAASGRTSRSVRPGPCRGDRRAHRAAGEDPRRHPDHVTEYHPEGATPCLCLPLPPTRRSSTTPLDASSSPCSAPPACSPPAPTATTAPLKAQRRPAASTTSAGPPTSRWTRSG